MDILTLKGIGAARAAALRAAGIFTVADLLEFLPRDYDDRSDIRTVERLVVGAVQTIRGTPAQKAETVVMPRRGGGAKGKRPLTLTKTYIKDRTGTLELVWFNQPYLEKTIMPGREYVFTGAVRAAPNGRMQMQSPDYEAVGEITLGAGRIVPLYTPPPGFSQKTFRALVHQALERLDVRAPAGGGVSSIPETSAGDALYISGTPAGDMLYITDTLPAGIRVQYMLCSREAALRNIHFPESDEKFLEARRRLVFEELFMMQAALFHMKGHVKERVGMVFDDVDCAPLLAQLGFAFTDAQRKVLAEITNDMQTASAMNRLIQGDVGSGKTAVAMAAAYIAIKNGTQAVIMAPTEVLARQHFEGFSRMFAPLGINTVLLTGGLAAAERKHARAQIADGKAQMIVGTHALVQKGVKYHRPGLVITDEQHRFGVNQRFILTEKGGVPDNITPQKTVITLHETASASQKTVVAPQAAVITSQKTAIAPQTTVITPHTLVMTATPIPRTLALILYGDLDISIIDELPPGRVPVKTYVVDGRYRARIHEFIRKTTETGQQAYIICPAIEERGESILNQAITEPDYKPTAYRAEIKNVIAYTAELCRTLPGVSVSYLHGRMKPAEKQQIMDDFKANRIQVLISTTVIEVGVHVANATLMLVENAERFGLSQLHQLRGRVGRGARESFCILISDAKAPETKARLQAMADTTDGFILAERDLEARGGGDFFGTRQHGLPAFKIANLYRDTEILKEAQTAARAYIKKGGFPPDVLRYRLSGVL